MKKRLKQKMRQVLAVLLVLSVISGTAEPFFEIAKAQGEKAGTKTEVQAETPEIEKAPETPMPELPMPEPPTPETTEEEALTDQPDEALQEPAADETMPISSTVRALKGRATGERLGIKGSGDKGEYIVVKSQEEMLTVAFQPTEEAKGQERYVEISGLYAAGLTLKTDPLPDKVYIKKVETSGLGESLVIKVYLTEAVTTGTAISFTFGVTIRKEIDFVRALSMDSHITAIKLKEYNGTTKKSEVSSDMATLYTYQTDDLYTTEKAAEPVIRDKFSKGMCLITRGSTVDGFDGAGWQNKEGDYILSAISSRYSGVPASGLLGESVIQDLRIEIPLPAFVTYVGSPHDKDGGLNGIKVSQGKVVGNTHYIIVEIKEYNPIETNLSMKMTLDYTGLQREGSVEQDGIDNYHNFFSNNRGKYPEENQWDLPWKWTGKIYGAAQSGTFYDRSKLVLDTLEAVESSDYFMNGSYKTDNYDSGKEIRIDSNGLKDIGTESTDSAFTMLHTAIWLGNSSEKLEKQWLLPRDYTRSATLTMDWAIQLNKIHFNKEPPSDIKIVFTTNTGNSVTKYIGDVMGLAVEAPPCGPREYYKTITVSKKAEDSLRYYFTGKIMDTDIDGKELATRTTSSIKISHAIDEYGRLEPRLTRPRYESDESKYIYQDLPAAFPRVDCYSSPGPGPGSFKIGQTYNNVKYLNINNNNTDAAGTSIQNLTDVKVNMSPTYVFGRNDESNGNLFFQLTNQSPTTVHLQKYTNPTKVTINYKTKKKPKEYTTCTIESTDFAKTGDEWTANVNFGLGNDDYILEMEVVAQEMPAMGQLTLTSNTLDVRDRVLPDGRRLKDFPRSIDSSGEIRETSDHYYKSVNWTVTNKKGTLQYQTYNNISGLDFDIFEDLRYSEIIYSAKGVYKENPPKLPGEITEFEINLGDVAFNPTYAFEIDKNFIYVPGSFKGIGGKEYKIVEEWLPNYFKSGGEMHEGNGLLRIRFIGNGEQAFNMFPVKRSRSNSSVNESFSMELQSKMLTQVATYIMVPAIYRSDSWSEKNLTGKTLEVEGYRGVPGLSERLLINEYYNKKLRIADTYDVDGDGNTKNLIYENNRRNSTFKSEKQQILANGSTRVDGYLVDPVTGREERDSLNFPHQKSDFVQLMEIVTVSIADYKDFIGYYHIPKKGHKITHETSAGGIDEHESTFDINLTDFIKSSVGGIDITDKDQIGIYYYVSDHPEDVGSDNHNEMAELKDLNNDPKAESENFKTKAEIMQEANDDPVKIKAILARVTMIKIKAPTLHVNQKIICKTTFEMGHKPGPEEYVDYFSGIYRYSDNTGIQTKKQYTPLMTFKLLDYEIKGTLWHDKNANSIMDPLESGIAGTKVELWQTGKDPHTGDAIEDGKISEVTTGEDGSYSFTQSYHGDYFLKFKVPEGKKLSKKEVEHAADYDASVFEIDEADRTVAKATFSLDDKSFLYQNAGLVDERDIEVPADMYISVNESRGLNYFLTPDYLMYDQYFKITPEITSAPENDEFFTVDPGTGMLTGIKEGTGTISISIPDAPLDGISKIEKTVNVHVEPANVASVSVPTKAEIYAVKGKANEIIAPILTINNYDEKSVKAMVRSVDINNTGDKKDLRLVKAKSSYATNEISLNITPASRENNVFKDFAATDITQIEYSGDGMVLGTMDAFTENANWGAFTFSGQYNENIVETDLKDNKFVMSYRFERVKP